jgi:hypothetical protein
VSRYQLPIKKSLYDAGSRDALTDEDLDRFVADFPIEAQVITGGHR